MKKIFLLIILAPFFVLAQTNGDSLKFEIIKASVNFLATDKASFPNTSGKSSKCVFDDYSCLLKFCETNQLKGADTKINKWKQKSIGSKDDLSKLKGEIINELTVGGDRVNRTKLESFKKYNGSLNKIVNSYKVTPKPIAEPSNQEAVKEDSQTPSVDSSSEPIIPLVIKTENPQEENSQGWFSIIAFLFSCIALGLGGFIFYKMNKRDKARKDFNSDYFILKEDVKDLRSKLAQKPTVDLKPFEEKLNYIENLIRQKEQQTRTVELQIENTNYNERKPSVNTQNAPQQFFAKLPDLGNGFSAGILSANQNGEQIFELEVNNDKGEFVVSGDSSAQKYALSDFNFYLLNACDFVNQPVRNCRINTIQKGIIIKSGSNWIIQNKAKIEFR